MPPSLVVELRRSPTWLCIGVGMLAAVTLLLSASGVQGVLSGVILAGVAVAVIIALRAGGWLGGPLLSAVSFGPSGWRVRCSDSAQWRPVSLRGDCLVSSGLVILRFESTRRRPLSVLVFYDSADAVSLRRLRVLLRWYPDVLEVA